MIRRNSDLEVHLPDAGDAASVDIPEENDVDMATDENPDHLALPPHIAARFYRKSCGRRRPSAQSSRRSSMSSLHSHHSNISSHGGPQSDHVAQHLRRASIIENRKARLADRAAHGEKVRLRAAVAKAASERVREERAVAAQNAREKLLAEITAKCEEEVRRAKKKAEDMKERKAAEHERLKLEMAEKFAEAERRRLLYQQNTRRPRTASLPAVEEKKVAKTALRKLNQDTAAKRIQRTWRSHHSKKVTDEFLALDLSLGRIRAMTFEEVGALLSEERVLVAAAKFLRLCGLQDTDGGAMGERGAVRTFLSSYLILAHPAQVLSRDGEQEEDLIGKARDLLVVFEQVVSLLSSACSSSSMSFSTEVQVLLETYNVFFSAFHAWKSHDSTVLIEIMLAQFVELELIWQTVRGDRAGGAADDYQQGIRQNQILLLARLKRLAGPDKAMDMVKEALRKAKRERKRTASSHEAIPRETSVPPSSTDLLPDNAISPMSETFTNVAEAPHQFPKKQVTPHDRFTKALTALPDNRVIVHELLVNKEFKIDQTPYTQVRHQIMTHLCDKMRVDVAAGEGTTWTVAMASVIRDRLLRSLKPGNSLHVLISEVLDPAHIENQCNAGSFSYDSFFNFMGTILPKLCAPFRDSDVKAFAEDTSGDAIDRLARLMRIIDLMSLDHTNFMLHVAAPQLIEEAPGYEQRAFEKSLFEGTITLEKVRQFWQSNRKVVIDEMKKRDLENLNTDPQPPPAKVYAQGLVDIVASNSPITSDMIPETLDLDLQRIHDLHSRAYKIVATASILLTAKNLLKRDVRSQWKSEAERIISLDFSDIRPERVQSILESTHPMPPATRTQISSTIKRVLAPAAAAFRDAAASAIPYPSVTVYTGDLPPEESLNSSSSGGPVDQTATATFTDPVARLMLSRLRTHILTRLSASSASERVRTTTTASQGLAAAGMPEFVSEVGKIVETLGKIREVDWMCHGKVYEGIWSE
ncbi:hypothetical protein FQN54_002189 [Arachnomyces sp. PD_36]|nr:hypothetical protein FQN54_002189 [Arachnomyces sp. PD_36]